MDRIVEGAMPATAEQILNNKRRDIISLPSDSTLCRAIDLMNSNKIGAILVTEGEDLVGIWTERDLLRDALCDGLDLNTAKVADFMTRELKYAEHDDTILQLQDKFLGMRLRHLPVRKDGKCIGLLSVGDVMKSILNEKEKQLRELNSLTSWEYYENWKFKK
jgi:CBS domain-containing protein